MRSFRHRSNYGIGGSMSSYPDYIPIIKFILGIVALVAFFASGLAYAVLQFIVGAAACLIAIPIALVVMSIASRS